jgi:hypothetical protein
MRILFFRTYITSSYINNNIKITALVSFMNLHVRECNGLDFGPLRMLGLIEWLTKTVIST